jgi:acyl-CoA reductase-like NAD-dependent aldehyde dehydrogenase
MKVHGAFQFIASFLLYGFSIASATPSDVSSIQECKTNHVPNVHPPFVEPRIFRQGTVQIIPKRTTDSDGDSNQAEEFPTSSVLGCCSKVPIGEMPQLSTEQATDILDDAVTRGWKGGAGEWTQMSLSERIERIQDFIRNLQSQREAIIDVLMWEIGKNYKDAASEFDRTIQFIEMTIDTIQSLDIFNPNATIKDYGSSTHAFVRRNAIGIILCLGPYNYPLNEAYATLIPALLMGNVVIFKIPSIGGLSHLLTFDAFTKALPPNT